MARERDYDLIILGGGQAGVVAGLVAGQEGLKTLLIEKTRLGGEWLKTGTVPSKALLRAAQVAHEMRTAHRFGLQPALLSRESARGVLEHVRQTVGVVERAEDSGPLLRQHGVEIMIGDAAFIGSDALEVAEREGPVHLLTADHFLLTTGSRPASPEIEGIEQAGYITSEDVFELDEIPESLMVIGGGSIGVEMAQAFSRLGSRVMLVEMKSRLLPLDDLEAARTLEEALRTEGLELRLDTRVVSARAVDGRKVMRVEYEGTEQEISTDMVLIASGRRPNIEGLNLEAAGVVSAEAGVRVTPTLHTTGTHVWACGDVIGRYQLSHMAEYEARLVVRNILYPFDRKTDPAFNLAPWATFTDPELAHVGLTEEQAHMRGVKYRIYRQPFAQTDRALTDDSAGSGFVKVLATGWQGKILGAHIVGPRAGELIQEWIQAMSAGLTMKQVAETLHVYPTLSMANQRAAGRWQEERRPGVRSASDVYTQMVRPNAGKIAWSLAGAAALVGGVFLLSTMQRRDEEE